MPQMAMRIHPTSQVPSGARKAIAVRISTRATLPQNSQICQGKSDVLARTLRDVGPETDRSLRHGLSTAVVASARSGMNTTSFAGLFGRHPRSRKHCTRDRRTKHSSVRPTSSRTTLPRTQCTSATSMRPSCSCKRSPQNIAEGAQDKPVFGPAARGDANELARLEPFLVVASPGIDSPADEQTTDQVLGRHTVAQLDQHEVGARWVGVQSRHQRKSLEEAARMPDVMDALSLVLDQEVRPRIEIEEVLGEPRGIPEITVVQKRLHPLGRHHGIPGPDPRNSEVLGHALDDYQVREPVDFAAQAAIGVVVSLAGEVDEALVQDHTRNVAEIFQQVN